MMDMLMAVVSGFIGAVIAIIFTSIVEYSRKPKIRLHNPTIVEGTYSDGTQAKTPRLTVTNGMLPKCTRWVNRQAAINTYGYIDFYNAATREIVKQKMPLKWAYEQGLERLNGNILLVRRFRDVSFVDIHSGEEQIIDVASKYDSDKVIYGWCYENYFSQPQWRNKKWEIGEGDYIVKVEIRFGGNTYLDYFRLCNSNGKFEFTNICPKEKKQYKKI